MRERVCKNCGGRQYAVVGQNMVKCQFCGTLYVDEQASKEEGTLTVWAYEKLREFKFKDALDEFDKILAMYPLSFEAYFGKVLAKHKIVLYSRRGTSNKKPRFFGDNVNSITEDDDFLSAIENAPEEVAKTYKDTARVIDKIVEGYKSVAGTKQYDVVLCAMNFDKSNPNEKIINTISKLQERNISTYFVQGLEKETEEETFNALKTAKVFVLYANKTSGYNESEVKNLFDRYRYFTSQKEKTSTSFVIAFDNGVTSENLPKELSKTKSVLDLTNLSESDALVSKIKAEKEKAVSQVAKIEKVKLEKIESVKKQQVEVETISATELGNYKVENLELSEANKINWVFISLKNGDFATARDIAKKELKKDPNNAELLFAELLCDYKVRTAGEFFLDIGNLKEKERIDNILKFAPKEFAEMIIDNWSDLVISLDSEEYYNSFLLYLAQYDTPNREKLVTAAENKALETLDQSLIEKVLKCFQNSDVDRFVNFYFMLAQKTGDDNYYKKALDIDEGHEQSKIAIFLKNFKDDDDILGFRRKDAVEDTLKYLDENKRVQLISSIVNIILPVAFKDLKKAQEQLDFYLGYVSDDEKLSKILKDVAIFLQQLRFYTIAEKYITIAISKNKNDAELYWILIQIKCHCNSEGKLVKTNVKISQMPEWESLLACATEKQAERYGAIISKANLYSGQKTGLALDWLDQKTLAEELNDFIIRNNKILLEMAKEEGRGILRGANYFKLQIQPFEKYVDQLKKDISLEEYQEIAKKIATRLDLLDLTLDMSINVTKLEGREEGLRAAKTEKLSVKGIKKKKDEKSGVEAISNEEIDKHKKFTRRYLFGFLELFPVLFATLLLIIIIAIPKEVYMYFNQNFVLALVGLGAVISIVHLTYYLVKKQKMHKNWKTANIALISIGFVNIALMCVGFYLMPTVVTIDNAKEFNKLVHNAPYATLRLENDINMEGIKWKATAFMGTLDGNGKIVENLTISSKKNISLFYSNSGTIENLTVYYSARTYKDASNFGGIAVSNTGDIRNCRVYCHDVLKINTEKDFDFGGIASRTKNGVISKCSANLNVNIVSRNNNLDFGGIAGVLRTSSKFSFVRNFSLISLTLNQKNVDVANVGGVVGKLESIDKDKLNFSKNRGEVHFSIVGNADTVYVGGLVGDGSSGSKNNYSNGNIDISANVAQGGVGGLYGRFHDRGLDFEISHSYSSVSIACDNGMYVGSLAGRFIGVIRNTFTTTDREVVGKNDSDFANATNAVQRSVKTYKGGSPFNFDKEIWDFSGSLPLLK